MRYVILRVILDIQGIFFVGRTKAAWLMEGEPETKAALVYQKGLDMELTTRKEIENLALNLDDEFDVNLLLTSDNGTLYNLSVIEQCKDNLIFAYFDLFPLHNYLTKAALVQKRETRYAGYRARNYQAAS